MKNTILKATAALLLGLSSPAYAFDGVTVEDAYSYATTSVQKNGAAFMRIVNDSDQNLSVTAARGDVAQSVELHTHKMDGDTMMMREVESYDLPAHQTTTLKPRSHHIMLMGLNAPLKLDETFPLTLEIAGEDGTTEAVDVSISIVKPGAKPEKHDHGGHHHE